jgi:hypothetical protein
MSRIIIVVVITQTIGRICNHVAIVLSQRSALPMSYGVLDQNGLIKQKELEGSISELDTVPVRQLMQEILNWTRYPEQACGPQAPRRLLYTSEKTKPMLRNAASPSIPFRRWILMGKLRCDLLKQNHPISVLSERAAAVCGAGAARPTQR